MNKNNPTEHDMELVQFSCITALRRRARRNRFALLTVAIIFAACVGISFAICLFKL